MSEEMKISKNKNEPCITEDEIRKVLEETVMTASSIIKSEWDFCTQAHGLFYWENRYNKARIGACLNHNSGVWKIYHDLNLNHNVYICIYSNTRNISWEGAGIHSTIQAYMYLAFAKLSELIKDESAESKLTEGEREMKNEDNYIKMDGEKDSFEGGAIRYTKKGKGRYDLIPSQQIHDILDYAKLNWDNIIGKDEEFCSIHNVLMSAYPDADDLTYDNYIEIIINIIRYCYIVTASNQVFDAFMIGFVKMLKDLAIHYEMGAEKYGADNWKNGIPETKGERGGSFRDSGLRHLQQLLDGQTDEPHQISAIWNFIGAMYVKKHQAVCKNEDTSSDALSVISFGKEIKMFYNNKNLIIETPKDGEITCNDYCIKSSIPDSVIFADYGMKFAGNNELGQKYYVYLGRFSRESGLTIDISKVDEPDSHLVGQRRIYEEEWTKINIALHIFIIKLKNNKPSPEVKTLTTLSEPMVFIREETPMQTCVLKLNDDTITLKTDDEELEFKISDMLCYRETFLTNIDSKETILITSADIKSKDTYLIKFEIESEEKVNAKKIRLTLSKANVSGIIWVYHISSQIVWEEIFKSSKLPIKPNDPYWTKFISSLNITEVRPV